MTTTVDQPPSKSPEKGAAFEVLLIFLRLGLTSFGGPIAHIGYFRDEFVARRRWLDEQAYADLVALCQFLPGPGEQPGRLFDRADARRLSRRPCRMDRLHAALGHRCSCFRLWRGALGGPLGAGLLHGLKLVAVAIVAQAVWGMARTLCPDRRARVDRDGRGAAHSVQQLPRWRRSRRSCSAASPGFGSAAARRRRPRGA